MGSPLLFRYISLHLFLLLPLFHTCNTLNNCTSSCGNIPNITYPFRLKTDPLSCGNKTYELACENNRTVLYYNSVYPATKYYVQSINYNNFTIRVVDANVQNVHNCSSFPHNSPTLPSFTEFYFGPYAHWDWTTGSQLYESLVIINCGKRVNSPLFKETYPCFNSTSYSTGLKDYSYVNVGPVDVTDLVDSCQIERITITSLLPQNSNNISFENVYDSIAYGFELSWFETCCLFNYPENPCKLDRDNIKSCLIPTNNEGHSYPRLRAVLLFLDSLLGKLLTRIKSEPELYYQASLNYYLVTLLRYLLALLILIRASLFLIGVVCLIFLLIYVWQRRHLSIYHNVEAFLHSHNNLMPIRYSFLVNQPIRYSYSNIKKITKCFKDKLGEGGYGSVYKGTLRSGHIAAVKILGKSNANGQDFINEVATIGRIHHVNVVRLIGFCAEGSKRALVYEFMPNGSLDKYVFSRKESIPISQQSMYDISLGVARGIEYLHRGCDMQILHFDIKPHNILLDEKFIPKISDFGLAKSYSTDNSIVSLTAARGTIGYMAPELFYKSIGGISYKADVYSFGMLLMEMAGRRKNFNAFTNRSSQVDFPSWVYDQIYEGNEIELKDVTEEEREITKKMIIVALWCIQLKPTDRPPMHRVVEMLEGKVEHLETPQRPFFALAELEEKDTIMEANFTSLTDSVSECSDSVSLLIGTH